VRHKYPALKPLMDFLCNVFKRRSLTDHFCVNARKPGDEGGNFPSRIDEGMEFIRDLVPIVVVYRDLRNAVVVRVTPRCFYINNRVHDQIRINRILEFTELVCATLLN